MTSSPELAAITDSVVQLRTQLEALPSSRRLPDSVAEHIYAMAYNLLGQGRNGDAQRYFEVLTLYRPTDARFLAGLGVCNQALGHPDQAITNYAFAAHVDPGKPEYMLAIAECELLQKDYDMARQTLAIVIRFCKEKGGFEKTRLRAEGMLALMPRGENPAPA